MKEFNLRFLKNEKLTAFVKKYKYILLIGLCGVILLLIPAGSDGASGENVVLTSASGFDVKEYERQLEQILNKVDGVGSVTVMLSLKSGTEMIYASDNDTSTSQSDSENGSSVSITERKTIVKQSNGDEPVVIKIIYPEFAGAIIVCDGAGSADTRYNVIKAVASVTGLGTDKITVLKSD